LYLNFDELEAEILRRQADLRASAMTSGQLAALTGSRCRAASRQLARWLRTLADRLDSPSTARDVSMS
jgi:hypothetical protein